MALDRRTFIKSALAGAGAAALGGPAQAATGFVNLALPGSTQLLGRSPATNINHVVVVMMENRSCDHYLGWWGERDDVRFNARTTLDSGGLVTEDWGTRSAADFDQHENYTGIGYGDPGHGHGQGRYQMLDFDGDGVSDGWTRFKDDGDTTAEKQTWPVGTSRTDRFALSYYRGEDLPVISQVLRDFTAFDRYHCSWLGSTYPNRYFMHSAQAGGITSNAFPQTLAQDDPALLLGWQWPTLWDVLSAKAVTWKYYYSNLPAIGLFGPEYMPNARPIAEYYADAAAGLLPQVCFVDPWFTAPEGINNDDHPHADIRLGQEFYSDVIRAFLSSPCWARGAMWVNYDEWGGFWDHVVPPTVGQDVEPRALFRTAQAAPDYRQLSTYSSAVEFGLYGFRTPAFLLSPYARNTGRNPIPAAGLPAAPGGVGGGRGPYTIDRTVSGFHDHTTILQFICDNWGLPAPGQWDPGFSRTPLGSMMEAFDPSVREAGNPGLPEVDVDAYRYVAPASVRATAVPVPPESVSDLWAAADWLTDLGYQIYTDIRDALPETR